MPAAPRWLRRAIDALPPPLALLQTSLLFRRCRQLAAKFDGFATAANEADFGGRGLQYVHFPWTYPERPPADLRWYHGRWSQRAYRALCTRIAGFSAARMRANLTLANSRWTAAKFRELHGIEPLVVSPPMMGEPPAVPWEARENGFVCVGRLSPEKELDKVIYIVAAVRRRGHDVHLHLLGSPRGGGAYVRRLRRRARADGEWLFIEEDLPRPELLRRIAQHRYGIHGMVEEHFGMAVMEMVRAGCVVLVPRGGGQVEIVGDEGLSYADARDAVRKIDVLLTDETRRAAARASLAARAERFAPAAFVERIRQLARELFG
jgi:glycosyltransferase involved in cell wall biosynthesis